MTTKYPAQASYYQGHESDRLFFRPFEPEDIQRWLPFFDDTPSLKFMGMESRQFKTMPNPERAAFWIKRQTQRQQEGIFGQLAVLEKETGRFLGVGGLITRLEEQLPDELEVTYALLPEARGKGYATELSVYFRKWAFDHTEVPSVISIIHTTNHASIGVATKNGMTPRESMEYFEMPVHLFRVER